MPIIFAILCRASGVPHSEEMFNIVFLCTLVSLVVQGTTLPLVAKWLRVSKAPKERPHALSADFDIDFPEEIKSATMEIEITPSMLEQGSRLMDLSMPEKTLVIMVKRGDHYFVPTGMTVLHAADRLMVISDNQAELDATLHALGIAPLQEPPPRRPKRHWKSVFFDDSSDA